MLMPIARSRLFFMTTLAIGRSAARYDLQEKVSQHINTPQRIRNGSECSTPFWHPARPAVNMLAAAHATRTSYCNRKSFRDGHLWFVVVLGTLLALCVRIIGSRDGGYQRV